MSSSSKPHVHALLKIVRLAVPSDHFEWFEAMKSEIRNVPGDTQLSFVCGCLITAVRWRVLSKDFILAAAQFFLICGAVFWAAMNIWLAGRMAVSGVQMLEWFAYCAAGVFLVGALATARLGFKATIGLGAPMILILAIAALTAGNLLPPSTTSTMLFALIMEDIVVLLIAVIIAFVIPRLAKTEKALEL